MALPLFLTFLFLCVFRLCKPIHDASPKTKNKHILFSNNMITGRLVLKKVNNVSCDLNLQIRL